MAYERCLGKAVGPVVRVMVDDRREQPRYDIEAKVECPVSDCPVRNVNFSTSTFDENSVTRLRNNKHLIMGIAIGECRTRRRERRLREN